VIPPAPVRPAAPALTAPARPAPPAVAAPSRRSPPARSAQVAALTPAAPARAAARPVRFAIEFGPFVVPAEAERVERRLSGAGYATTRSRQPSGSAVYAVLIERVPTTQEARTLASALREQGLGDAVVVSRTPVVLRVGPPVALRAAVELAERLRAAGHHVRIAAQPGEAPALIVRHGAFASRDEAEARRRELGQLDLPAHQVVQVR
jgi:cell division septation protein DedD